jgi:hypothetical protein
MLAEAILCSTGKCWAKAAMADLAPILEEIEFDLEVKMVQRSCTTTGKRIEEGIRDGSINWI